MQQFPIDVVIPVYDAPADLARCVDSVLTRTTSPYRLILIDDASPDPAIGRYFADLEQRGLPHVLLLRNAGNLGFTGTSNRGMALSRADVVLLNSDTIVTRGWLDAFMRCAASDPRIGTATPFSNNAGICSYPRFCVTAVWPEGLDPEPVRRALEQAAVPTYPDLPTGVGFCLFVRRALIDAIGPFDMAFGKGYGEENDFCVRAVRAGFRNVLCDDAFVLHVGGSSFGDRQAELRPSNMSLLQERYPRYFETVQSFIDADPLRPIREAALARVRASGARAGILHVVEGSRGSTVDRVRALIATSPRSERHYLAIASGDRWQVEESLGQDGMRRYEFCREARESWPDFVGSLCATFRVDSLHRHPVWESAPESTAVYDAALASAPRSPRSPFAPARVRDALGYVPWTTLTPP